jgi:3-oxoacyl-[acyl-carrier protein] reductase
VNDRSSTPSSPASWTLAGKVALVTGASRGIGRAIGAAARGPRRAVAINYAGNEAAAREV